MAKRLVVLVGVLVLMLVTAVPAFAQQEVSATGVLTSLGPAPEGEPDPRYAINDTETGSSYELFSVRVDLEPYVGDRVTVSGVGAAAPPSRPGFANLLGVTGVEPADAPTPGPAPERSATFDFGLTVKGEPPAGARFFGAVPAEGCISVPLTDPDGDGVFTGSVDVPRFPPGPVPPDAEPVSLPVQIVQANSGAGPCNPTTVIKDFGTVPADDDTFRAKVNFKKDREDTTPPENTTPDTTAPGGSGNSGSGGSSSGGSGSGSSGSGSSGSGSSGSGSGGSGARPSSSTGGEMKILPRTGGTLPTLGVVGALLVAGGLLVRRAAR